jgi:hypothetical protein
MLYKTPREEQELEQACPALQLVAGYFEALSQRFGIEPVITRILEPIKGESGVHQDYRAVDFRNEMGVGGPRLYTDEQAKVLVDEMNKRFPRKDNKLVCIHHSFVNNKDPNSKPAPFHFHVQICWEWKKNGLPEELDA